MPSDAVVCRGCGTVKDSAQWGQWWHLNNYHGFRGSFCGTCYDMISHDANGKPCNPGQHLFMVLKLQKENA